jgi:lipoic acid synthetase
VLKKPDWIRVRAPGSPGLGGYPRYRAREQSGDGLRGGRLPEYRRVLVEEARLFHDPGRHLHPGLRLLQRAHRPSGAVDHDEPENIANAVAKMGLAHVVVTSVDRDDLPDGGAGHFAAVIRAIRATSPQNHD